MNMEQHQKLIEKIFNAQDEQGFWKVLPESDKYYPDYLHYVGSAV
jgi:hypothetical protein